MSVHNSSSWPSSVSSLWVARPWQALSQTKRLAYDIMNQRCTFHDLLMNMWGKHGKLGEMILNPATVRWDLTSIPCYWIECAPQEDELLGWLTGMFRWAWLVRAPCPEVSLRASTDSMRFSHETRRCMSSIADLLTSNSDVRAEKIVRSLKYSFILSFENSDPGCTCVDDSVRCLMCACRPEVTCDLL